MAYQPNEEGEGNTDTDSRPLREERTFLGRIASHKDKDKL